MWGQDGILPAVGNRRRSAEGRLPIGRRLPICPTINEKAAPPENIEEHALSGDAAFCPGQGYDPERRLVQKSSCHRWPGPASKSFSLSRDVQTGTETPGSACLDLEIDSNKNSLWSTVQSTNERHET